MKDIKFIYGELNKKVHPVEYSVVVRESKDFFPEIGSITKIYISLDNTKMMYFWEPKLNKYSPILPEYTLADAGKSLTVSETGELIWK